MPITKSAKKALRSSRRKRQFNLGRLSAVRQATKVVRLAAAANPIDPKALTKAVGAAYQAIDKAAKRDVIKKNTAGRKKSRVARMALKSLAAKSN